LLYQHTDRLAAALQAGPVAAYAGFDPTADSLHVGSLVVIAALARLSDAGHRPVALVGGGTGLIGDPSGKAAERQLVDRDLVAANSAKIGQQLERLANAELANNAQWLEPLDAIGFLRDVGKHYTVNYMLQKDSVRSRMDAGISFTEFAYMLLQSYDFLQLHQRHGVTLQIGGSDQWGNITAGIELIRRTTGAEAHALTLPLVTTASGTKFGKTEEGTIWLDAAKTSPYQFYQFWINVDDGDVGRYLRYFTMLPHEEIENLEAFAADSTLASQRTAQRALATRVTNWVHGNAATVAATEVSNFLFAGGSPEVLTDTAFDALKREIPGGTLPRPADGAVDVLTLLTTSGLAQSRGAARRLVQQGGVSIDGRRLPPEELTIPADTARRPGWFLIKKGARDYALVQLLA
jgi:tyrosyl-tRNA synthetase